MKQTKKLLALLLALALCVTPAAWSDAEETDTADQETASVTQAVIYDSQTNAEVTEMAPGVITTGTDTDIKSKQKVYGLAVPATADDYASKGEAVFKIVLPQKGRLLLAVSPLEVPESASVTPLLYKDEACTDSVAISSSNSMSLNVLDKGTYYLSVKVYDSNATQVNGYSFGAALSLIPGGNQTLKNKTWKMISAADYSTPVYAKISVPKTSKITVDAQFINSGYITLCNSSKKAVSEKVYISSNGDGKAYFAAPKGTYYIKATTSDEYYRVKYTLGTVKNQTGASKSSAKSLAVKGAKLNGYYTTADKTGKQEWFKFSNTKNQKIVVYANSQISSGKIKIEFFSSNGKSMGSTSLDSYTAGRQLTPYTIGAGYSGKTLAKGTYYIKITKGSKNTSGTFDFQIKTK